MLKTVCRALNRNIIRHHPSPPPPPWTYFDFIVDTSLLLPLSNFFHYLFSLANSREDTIRTVSIMASLVISHFGRNYLLSEIDELSASRKGVLLVFVRVAGTAPFREQKMAITKVSLSSGCI